jgi:hypothetical protein
MLYEAVCFEGDDEDTTVKDFFVAFVRTIATRPYLEKLVRELSMSNWHHHLEGIEALPKEIIAASDMDDEDLPSSAAEDLGHLVLSRLTELRSLHIDYPGEWHVLRGCLFHNLVDVSINADDGSEGEEATEYFDDAISLLSLPHLCRLSVSCALIEGSDVLKLLPPKSSNVQEITISCRSICETSLQLLLALSISLRVFRWWNRVWTCHTEPDETTCITVSITAIAKCLTQVKYSLEVLDIKHICVLTCPHNSGALDGLRDFPKLKEVTLTPQMLLGWSRDHSTDELTLEHPNRPGMNHISDLLPQSLGRGRNAGMVHPEHHQ